MSSSNFIKHLVCALSSRCFHQLSHRVARPCPSSIPRFFTGRKARELPKPIPFAADISASLSSVPSSETSRIDSFASPYLSVNVRCHKDVADMLSEALLCFGASSTTIHEKDAGDTSNEICIDSIFPEDEDVSMCISHAADSIGLKQIPKYEVKLGDQYDWIKKTQESFNPVEVTEGLWIVPEWTTPPDVQATNIILNPGLAFGTGEHPTTKLCLLLLHRLIRGGELFLDYGTGSGILAIAALKFGAALSVGIDIDPVAIASARQNASLNDIGTDKVQLHLVPSKTSSRLMDPCGVSEEQSSDRNEVIFKAEKYDVVVANILLNPLLDLSENIVSFAKPGAVVGLSGILREQVPSIMDRYSQFLEAISVTEMDDWACVCGIKKTNPATS
ncbi:hypothetical protein UlMin_028448 [Ulmus minor]